MQASLRSILRLTVMAMLAIAVVLSVLDVDLGHSSVGHDRPCVGSPEPADGAACVVRRGHGVRGLVAVLSVDVTQRWMAVSVPSGLMAIDTSRRAHTPLLALGCLLTV